MQRVLIVDDNPSVGKALQLLLELHDIEGETVLTPQAALTRLEQDESIALVIQDMNFTEDTTSGEDGHVTDFEMYEPRGGLHQKAEQAPVTSL